MCYKILIMSLDYITDSFVQKLSKNMEPAICRVCLNKTASISLFDKNGDEELLSVKIMRFVNVHIVEGDGLPGTICEDCAGELALSYQFVNKCQTSDKTLREQPINLDDCKIEINVKVEEVDFYDDSISQNSSDVPTVKKYKKRKKIAKKSKGPIQCVICGTVLKCQSALDNHMRVHTGEKPFPCPMCDARFPYKASVTRHMETNHKAREARERNYVCETCGSSFFTKNDIIVHLRVHTDERPYTCPYCPKRFRQIGSQIRHVRIHTGERPFPCPTCNKTFADKNVLQRHQSVHSDEKNFTCHLCSKGVKTRNALMTHMKIHSNEKRHICSYCGMAFTMKGNLQTHIGRIHSEKSGQCTVCHKTFPDLEAHMRKHTGERPFACKLCEKSFGSKRSLSHHMVFRHENASKFKCSIGDCTKTFPTATMLEFHLLKQHTNHTPYICHHCSRGFFRSSDLSRHLRVNHLDSPLKIPMKSLVN